MGRKGYFAILFAIIILVFFLFPLPTATEHYLVPQKLVRLDENPTLTDQTPHLSFSLGEYYGYFTEDLDLTYLDKRDYRVAINDSSFIDYPKIPSVLNIQNHEGSIRAPIESAGYPFIEENKVVIISDSSLSLYDIEGNLYWERSILSMVTSISINSESVAVGYLDGTCELISFDGSTLLSYKPGGSRIEIIYSVASSSDGQKLAILSGLDPQRFIYIEKRKEDYKPIHHFEMDFQYRKTIKMNFSKDNSKIFMESPDGVEVYTVLTGQLDTIVGDGNLKEVYYDNALGFYSLMLQEQGSATVKVLTDFDKELLDREFAGGLFFFRKVDQDFYVGIDNDLLHLKLVDY